jgi:hypothetical protein
MRFFASFTRPAQLCENVSATPPEATHSGEGTTSMRFLPIIRVARLSPLIAPILLCAVALVQLYVTRTTLLTPWKGGGFGMFSTVDSPSVRFLRIALQTDRGAVYVEVPPRFQREAMRLREAPDERSLHALAEKLAAGKWIPDEAISAEASYALMMQAISSRGGVLPLRAVARGGETVYRMLSPGESSREPPLNVGAVCIDVWRYRVEQQTTLLVANRLMQACAGAH